MAHWLQRVRRYRFSGRLAAGSSHSYFTRFIWIGCISGCVPILIAGMVYYQFAMDRVERQIWAESKSSLMLMKDRAEQILQGVEKDVLQLSVDPVVRQGFDGPGTDHPLLWYNAVLDRLSLAKNANPFIDDVAIVQNLDERILSNRYGAMGTQYYPAYGDLDRQLEGDAGSLWWRLSSRPDILTISRRLPTIDEGSAPKQGLLVFDLDLAMIQRFVGDDTALLTVNGQIVLVHYPGLAKKRPEERRELLDRFMSHAALPKIQAADASADSFFAAGLDQHDAHFTYLKSVYGRTYLSIVPETLIADRLAYIRVFTLLLLVFLVTLGVLLTYFGTKKAYSPIQQLIEYGRKLGGGRIARRDNEIDDLRACLDYLNKETQKLGGYIEQLQPTLRERCLQGLLDGEYVRSESLIRDCQTYGLSVTSRYIVMVVQVDDVYKTKRFLPGDKSIVAFAITNVMQELLDKQSFLTGHAFSYQGKAAALLECPQGADRESMPGPVFAFAKSVCDSLRHYLSFHACIGIGRMYSHIADVPVSYNEALIALQYRMYRDTEPILYIEDLENSKKQATYRYPRNLENAIVDALTEGDDEAAINALSEFAGAVRASESFNFIHQSYHVLLSAVLTSLEKQGASILDILEYNLFGDLESRQTTRDMNDWFAEVMFPLYRKVTDEKRSVSGLSAVSQVCKHIREHCMDDLSLVQCAEMVGMSPSYLSRLFKKEMGVNFLEYVVECKVDEMKRLLLETDLSISDIAGRIGYSERNMSRIFQKTMKMTPSSFRSAHR